MKMDYRLDPPDEDWGDTEDFVDVDDGFDPDAENDRREDREYDREGD